MIESTIFMHDKNGVKDRLENARKARAEALKDGKSPRARGEEKTLQALDWIYRWRWSTPSIIELLTGGSRSALTSRLVKNGLIQRTQTASAGGVPDIPRFILTLTAAGLAHITKHQDDLLDYELDPRKIRQDQLKHYVIAQRSTLNALLQGDIVGFRTEAQNRDFSQQGIKQPDCIWTLPSGKRQGMEVELTGKYSRKLDQFVHSCILSLSNKASERNKVDSVVLITDSHSIYDRYSKAFEVGSTYRKWKKKENNFWVEDGVLTVPESTKYKLLCLIYSN